MPGQIVLHSACSGFSVQTFYYRNCKSLLHYVILMPLLLSARPPTRALLSFSSLIQLPTSCFSPSCFRSVQERSTRYNSTVGSRVIPALGGTSNPSLDPTEPSSCSANHDHEVCTLRMSQVLLSLDNSAGLQRFEPVCRKTAEPSLPTRTIQSKLLPTTNPSSDVSSQFPNASYSSSDCPDQPPTLR